MPYLSIRIQKGTFPLLGVSNKKDVFSCLVLILSPTNSFYF